MPRPALSLILLVGAIGWHWPTADVWGSSIDPHLDPSIVLAGCAACHEGHGASRSPMLPRIVGRLGSTGGARSRRRRCVPGAAVLSALPAFCPSTHSGGFFTARAGRRYLHLVPLAPPRNTRRPIFPSSGKAASIYTRPDPFRVRALPGMPRQCRGNHPEPSRHQPFVQPQQSLLPSGRDSFVR